MAARPEEYRASSYRGYVRARRALPWIVCDKALGESGRDLSTARRAYGRFLRAGVDEPPPSPFGKAIGGLLLGSEKSVSRFRRLIDARPADAELPETKLFRSRPSLERILEAVSDHFGYEPAPWTAGRRSDDASRAAAAYLARRRFGYPAKSVAAALGYQDASGVSHAIHRIEEVLERLKQDAGVLGGEPSGHIICRDRTTTGDGIIAALQVLAGAQSLGSPVTALVAEVEKLPQTLVNVRLTERVDLSAHPGIAAAVCAAEADLKGQGRVLLRPSGTEPLIRVMVEGRDNVQVQAMAQGLAERVRAAVMPCIP